MSYVNSHVQLGRTYWPDRMKRKRRHLAVSRRFFWRRDGFMGKWTSFREEKHFFIWRQLGIWKFLAIFFFCKFFVIDSHMNHLPMVHFFWYKDISIHALQESGDGIQSLWCLSPSPCTQVTMIPIHKKLMILILEIETSECVYDYIYIV